LVSNSCHSFVWSCHATTQSDSFKLLIRLPFSICLDSANIALHCTDRPTAVDNLSLPWPPAVDLFESICRLQSQSHFPRPPAGTSSTRRGSAKVRSNGGKIIPPHIPDPETAKTQYYRVFSIPLKCKRHEGNLPHYMLTASATQPAKQIQHGL